MERDMGLRKGRHFPLTSMSRKRDGRATGLSRLLSVGLRVPT